MFGTGGKKWLVHVGDVTFKNGKNFSTEYWVALTPVKGKDRLGRWIKDRITAGYKLKGHQDYDRMYQYLMHPKSNEEFVLQMTPTKTATKWRFPDGSSLTNGQESE